MEAVILQIQATLVKGKARIVFSHVKVCRTLCVCCNLILKSFGLWCFQGESYTLAKAQHAYKSLVKIHEKSGEWILQLPPDSL